MSLSRLRRRSQWPGLKERLYLLPSSFLHRYMKEDDERVSSVKGLFDDLDILFIGVP